MLPLVHFTNKTEKARKLNVYVFVSHCFIYILYIILLLLIDYFLIMLPCYHFLNIYRAVCFSGVYIAQRGVFVATLRQVLQGATLFFRGNMVTFKFYLVKTKRYLVRLMLPP